jgi:hypothetical protein
MSTNNGRKSGHTPSDGRDSTSTTSQNIDPPKIMADAAQDIYDKGYAAAISWLALKGEGRRTRKRNNNDCENY